MAKSQVTKRSNSALLTDAYISPLRAQHGAAKHERLHMKLIRTLLNKLVPQKAGPFRVSKYAPEEGVLEVNGEQVAITHTSRPSWDHNVHYLSVEQASWIKRQAVSSPVK